MTRFLQTALATILTLVIGAAYGLVVHRPVVPMAGAQAAVFVDWCVVDTLIGCDAGPWRE